MSLPDNLIEYTDPIIYDLENATFESDGPFYLSLARETCPLSNEVTGLPLLELGCGTGRIAISLAREGFDVTGLDIMPEMLQRAREKARGKDGLPDIPVRWVQADARNFQLAKKFGLIYEPGAVFQHVHERASHEAILARVREHLLPEGRFALSTLFPSLDLMADEEEHEVWTYPHPDGYTVHVSFSGHYDRVRQVKTETAIRRWTNLDGQVVVRTAPLALRYFFPQELEALLHYNGFQVLEKYGDFDRNPLTEESHQIVYVCSLI
jgi:SAM-dependent methyltransferase